MPGEEDHQSGPRSGEDWRQTRDEWRKARLRRRARGGHRPARYGPPQGFGCLFGLVFLLIAGSLIAATTLVLSSLGALPVIVALGFLALVLGWMGRTLFATARELDGLVEATRRVSEGDYSVRIGSTRSSAGAIRAARQLDRDFDAMAARLEADERQRRTLLADISHELRTPLSVVQGHIEAILDGIYPADGAHLQTILEETRVLARLVDDLRTLALSEAGTLTLHREPTDLDVLTSDVVRSFEPAALTAGVELIADIGSDLPMVDIDPVRIREVISNLVANALRHTPSGGTIRVTGTAVDAGWVRLEVRDSGTGIEPSLLPLVFDRFAKGDASAGSGLGLAIARQLVVAHDGEIEATSEIGAGTTIVVRLPVRGE